LPLKAHDDVIVGIDHPDDCGVVRVSPDLAVVTTVDFITPLVDDPFDFGRIAAINSVSDIFAMGAKPVSALSVAGFPDTRLPLQVLTDILKGLLAGAEQCGVPIVGGHTVKSPEPLFGLAVTGVAHPDQLVLKSGAKAGDVLVLTKPLGSGVMTTALKNEKLSPEGIGIISDAMFTANDKASSLMLRHGVHAATDVTGFGLLGHADEMARACGLSFELDFDAIPVHDEAIPLAQAGSFPGGAKTNLENYAPSTSFSERLQPWQQLLLADPQTSGGLLIAFPADRLDDVLRDGRESGVFCAVIGRVTQVPDTHLVIS
jgi:selenide,water dikinase